MSLSFYPLARLKKEIIRDEIEDALKNVWVFIDRSLLKSLYLCYLGGFPTHLLVLGFHCHPTGRNTTSVSVISRRQRGLNSVLRPLKRAKAASDVWRTLLCSMRYLLQDKVGGISVKTCLPHQRAKADFSSLHCGPGCSLEWQKHVPNLSSASSSSSIWPEKGLRITGYQPLPTFLTSAILDLLADQTLFLLFLTPIHVDSPAANT